MITNILSTKHLEPNPKIRKTEMMIIILSFIVFSITLIFGFSQFHLSDHNIQFVQSIIMERNREAEDYSEDDTLCDVIYESMDQKMIITYSYEDYLKLDTDTILAYQYQINDDFLFFDHLNPTNQQIKKTYRTYKAEEYKMIFGTASVSFILLLSFLTMMLFSTFFTAYERIWFLSIILLSCIFSLLFPEESANGVNGIFILQLYLLDTFLNILCELLISKQSRINFLVSIGVEITEILMCFVLRYRFVTMAVTFFFWLPIDILSYFNWKKHKDEDKDELTIVRSLSGLQRFGVIVLIFLWTIIIGYLISGLDIQTDFITKRSLATLIIYMDACASAIGIANGVFILLRLKEQWIAWYIYSILDAIINILSGQYVLLVLKLGFLMNTTYGYIQWTHYIKEHSKSESQSN